MCLAIQPDNLAIIPEMRSMREKRIRRRISSLPSLEGNGNRDRDSYFVSFDKNYIKNSIMEASIITLNE